MNEEMMKSLYSLIDETIAEVEELKKSDRFSASEIKIDGPGTGIGGQDPDGKLGKDEDKDDKKDDKSDDDKDDKKDDKDFGKAEGKNSEADPNAGNHQVVSKEEDTAKGDVGYDMAKTEELVQKSSEEANTLLKSYVDEKITPIEDKLEKMFTLIKEIADAPVASKGQSFKDVQPLKKNNEDGGEALNKGQVVEKLFELKKSGEKVNTVDITSAELGNPTELAKIAEKYDLN